MKKVYLKYLNTLHQITVHVHIYIIYEVKVKVNIYAISRLLLKYQQYSLIKQKSLDRDIRLLFIIRLDDENEF